MDPSRFKRRETQRRRTTQVTFGVSDMVPRGVLSRTYAARPSSRMMEGFSAGPQPQPVATLRPAALSPLPKQSLNVAVMTPQTQIEARELEQAALPHLLRADMELPGQ